MDRFKFYNNFKIINEDVLKVDLKNLIKQEKNEQIKSVKIVANLPYYNYTNNNETFRRKIRY